MYWMGMLKLQWKCWILLVAGCVMLDVHMRVCDCVCLSCILSATSESQRYLI